MFNSGKFTFALILSHSVFVPYKKVVKKLNLVPKNVFLAHRVYIMASSKT